LKKIKIITNKILQKIPPKKIHKNKRKLIGNLEVRMGVGGTCKDKLPIFAV
jgi:hypothetical protein